MPDYRFVMRNNDQDQIVGELAAYDVHFDYALNGYGSFSFKVAMDDPIGDPFNIAVPKRHNVAIERDGVLVYNGMVWQRQLDYKTREITVSGNEWGSYYDKLLQFDYDNTGSGKTIGQALDDLLPVATSVGLYNSGTIRVGTGGGLSNVVDTFFDEASHMTIYAAIKKLAETEINGFEFRWTAMYGASPFNIERRCVVGSPLGVIASNVLDTYTPGGGASIHGFAVDSRDTFTNLFAYTSDNWRFNQYVWSFAGSPPGLPIRTDTALVLSSDYTDDDAAAVALNHFNVLGSGDSVDPTIKTYTIDVVAPPSLDFYGVEGDFVNLTVQRRYAEDPAHINPRITGRSVRIDTHTGQETLTISAWD